jgi:hypothetical protein
MPQLSFEARLQYEILRTEVRCTKDPDQLQQKALMLIDLLELQRRTTSAMLKQGFRGPGPSLLSFASPADA